MAHDTKKKQKLSNISFDHEGAHVALVGKHQGGPANGVETLLFKTKDTKHIMDQDLQEKLNKANVSVTMTFTEFLVRWFDMWWDDADVLATLLGMEEDWINEPSSEDYKEMIQERVDNIELMKSAEKALNEGQLQKFIDKLSEDEYASLRKTKRMLEKGLASSGSPEDGKQEDTTPTQKSSGKPQDDNKGKENMDQEELQKAIDKAREEGRSERQDELQKAQDKLEAIEKERKEKVQKEYEDLVKGYSFVEEGEQESLVKALMTVEGSEGANAIVDALEKAHNVVKEFGGPQGADGEGDIDAIEKSRQRVREHIQNRNK